MWPFADFQNAGNHNSLFRLKLVELVLTWVHGFSSEYPVFGVANKLVESLHFWFGIIFMQTWGVSRLWECRELQIFRKDRGHFNLVHRLKSNGSVMGAKVGKSFRFQPTLVSTRGYGHYQAVVMRIFLKFLISNLCNLHAKVSYQWLSNGSDLQSWSAENIFIFRVCVRKGVGHSQNVGVSELT